MITICVYQNAYIINKYSYIITRCWAVLDIVPQQNTCFVYTTPGQGHNSSFFASITGESDMPQAACTQNVSLKRWALIWMKNTFYPSALRAGGVLSSRFGRAGGCQTCGTHISVTAWWIFSIQSSVELSRPVVVHCHGHLPICPIWAYPWAKNLSNLPQIGSRLYGMLYSQTAGWIYTV